MTFDTRETSIQDGKPVYLFKFYRTGKAWYYTNADQDIVFNSNTYTAFPAQSTSIIQSGDAKSEDYQITLPAAATICTYFDSLTPTEQINVMLRKAHMDEDDSDGSFDAPTEISDAPVIWIGEVISLKRPTLNSRVFICNTLSLSLARGGLRLTWGRNCPHFLYDSSCKVNKADHMVALTDVSVVDGVKLAAAEFGLSNPANTTNIDNTDPCDDLATWLLNPGQIANDDYAAQVVVESGTGNPAPSFKVTTQNNDGNPAYAIKDFGVEGADTSTISFDLIIGDAGGNDGAFAGFLLGCSGGGNGVRVVLRGTFGGGIYLSLRNATTLTTGLGTILAESACASAFGQGIVYKISTTRVVDESGSATFTTTLKNITGATLGSVTATGSYYAGGWCGPIMARGDDSSTLFYDNVHVTGSLVSSAGGFAGGFIEWDSSTGVTERTGIESEGDGFVILLGTTQGMSTGTNFKAYAGCNRTAPQCNSKFKNILNYGGINHMQGRSPFDGQPVF